MWHLDRMQSGKAKRNEMNVSWYENYLGTFICAQLGTYKRGLSHERPLTACVRGFEPPDLLVRSQTLYPAELNAHLYRVLNYVAQQQNQVYIRKNNMSSIKMKKVQKILTSFLNGAMKAGLLVLIRDKDRSDSIW